MNDTDTWAMRIVNGGELYLRKHLRPKSRWEINFYDVTFARGEHLLSLRLKPHFFAGKTFKSPGHAAESVRRILAA